MNNKHIEVRGLLGLAAAAGAFAVNAETLQPEELVVWGTQVQASSLRLSEEAIAIRQSDHLSDLLRTVPGVDVGGSHSLNQRITIRSMDDKDLRISIDGANQNTYMYHHMGNLQIHADILKSVEIDVGRNSVVNGGLGGSARFETRDAADLLRAGEQFGARANIAVADNGSNSYSLAGFGQLTDAVNVLLYHNIVDRSNFRVGGGEILDHEGVEVGGTEGEVRGLQGQVTDTLAKLGWNITDNQRIKIGYEAYEDEGDYSYRPDMGLATDLVIAEFLEIPLLYPTEFTRDTATLNYELDLGAHTTIKATAYENKSTFWRDERGLITWRPPFAVIAEGTATNTGFNLFAESELLAVVEHRLTYGFEYIHFDTRLARDEATVSEEWAKTTALFVQDTMNLTEQLRVIPGVRYQNDNVESNLTDRTFDDVQLALAVEYEPASDWLFRASAAELFKSPELAEVFTGAGGGDSLVADIRAETGINSELSFAYQGEHWATGLTAFRTKIDNYFYEYSPGKDNIGDMTISGFESYIEYATRNLSVLLTLSRARGDLNAFEQYSTEPNYDGFGDSREQGDTVSLNVDYQLPSLDISLHWDVLAVDDLPAGRYLDSASLDNAKPGFTVHNVSARWTPARFAQGLAVTLGVDNLLDEYYTSQSSRSGLSFHPLFQQLFLMDYEPGRNIKASIAYQI